MKKLIATGTLVTLIGLSGCFNAQDDKAKGSANKEKQDAIAHHTSLCPSGTSDAGYSIRDKNVCELSSIITNELTLTSDHYWRIKGEVIVGGDNSHSTQLNIKPGTVLFGKSGSDFMIINRGSKIMAEGTKKSPIIFTSEQDIKNGKGKSGDWGGVVLAGNAPINSGVDDVFEFSRQNARFGGKNLDDNSGILKYVVIKYAGDEVMPQKELNGLSLGGVGRGTTIDYLEVYQGKDDGIELWGGNVNMKHVLLLGNRDDSLDTDLGYNGKIQYLYAEKFATEATQMGNGIESDNNVKDNDAKPITHPTLVNFEFVGSARSTYGILIRRGSSYTLVNGKVSVFEKAAFSLQDEATLQHNVKVTSVYLDANPDNLFYGRGIDVSKIAAVFYKDGTSKTGDNYPQYTEIKGDKFFEDAPFIGAYEEKNDWRKGWSVGL